MVKRDRNFSQGSIGHFRKDCPERLQKKRVSQANVLVTKEEVSASRKTKDTGRAPSGD